MLKELLDSRFGGVLKYGSHREDGECCAMELLSAARGIPWTDLPHAVRCFDLRSLNDIHVSDAIRTKHLLPVLEAYDGSLDWPKERQQAVAERLVILVVQRIISELPGLSREIRSQCRNANDVGAAAWAAAWAADAAVKVAEAASRSAWEAAWAADTAVKVAASRSAAYVAGLAAYVAGLAAVAASARARERVFITACELFLEAARDSLAIQASTRV